MEYVYVWPVSTTTVCKGLVKLQPLCEANDNLFIYISTYILVSLIYTTFDIQGRGISTKHLL